MNQRADNILFLDFDGVINNSSLKDEKEHVLLPTNFHAFLPKLAANLKHIINKYDFKIVVSSTWRKDFTIPEMEEILNKHMNLECELLDFTTKEYLDTDYLTRLEWDPKSISRDRGLQITKWLDERKYNVRKYVVIDDGIDAMYGHEKNFFLVNAERGFDNQALEQFFYFMESYK